MNKEQLINTVADKTGMKKGEVRQTVDEVFSAISDALIHDGKFQYIGFGSFMVKKRAGRTGVNPRTKEKMDIKARRVATFTPGKKLSTKIAQK
ncbi:MAG TPA: HU family DNA-binding protein [Candidatus Xenobia bacterium]